ncbi:MAG: sigma-70 family RNA polymerase sigma factor, partial [Verrucomicrobiota bacterium]
MPVEFDPDAALMLRVKQGDTAAFTALVEKYKQPVMNLAWRTLRDETEAEDLAQNVFVQAWKSAERYQATAKFSTWLFTIARNLCFNEIRRRVRHPAESLDQTRDDSEEQPLHQVVDKRIAAASDEML